jgi:hypothetical protein
MESHEGDEHEDQKEIDEVGGTAGELNLQVH